MRYATMLMLLTTLSLTACETSGQGSAQAFCSIAKPTYLNKDDKLTPATQRKIVGDNEIGAKLCGWKPPSKPGG